MADLTQTHMTAEEFLQLPESNQLIQLIHGEVIVSPTPSDLHQRLVGAVSFYLKQILPGGAVRLAPLDVYIDGVNVVQPDVFWVSDDNDQCVLVDGKYWSGAPTLVVEVLSPSTEGLDWREKFDLYEEHGVKEYWLVSQAFNVHVFWLQDGKFVRHGVFGLEDAFASPVLGDKQIDVKKLLDQ